MTKTCALLIGLDYPGYAHYRQLDCCVNDVRLMKETLTTVYQVPCENIRVLTDEQQGGKAVTWAELVLAIHQLAVDSWKKDLDAAVFMFSGHGTQVFADRAEGIEADGLDEGIAPSDYDSRGIIRDGYLRRLFEGFNPKTKVVCVFDCCHSGSIMDLPFYYINGRDETGLFIKKRGTALDASALDASALDANIFVFSACKDKEISADFHDELSGRTYGAMTKLLTGLLKEAPGLHVTQLQTKLNERYRQLGYNQTCVLSTSREIHEDCLSFL